MKNLLLSLKLIFKKSFGTTASHIIFYILAGILIIGFGIAVILLPAQKGDSDYSAYIAFPTIMTAYAAAAIFTFSTDLYSASYIRTSRLYKSIRTRALPITAFIFNTLAFSFTAITAAASGCEALPDIIMSFAVINFCFVVFSPIANGAWIATTLLMLIVNISNTFELGLFVNGYGADLTTALLLAAALSVIGLLIAFIISDILYKHRKRAKIRSTMKELNI